MRKGETHPAYKALRQISKANNQLGLNECIHCSKVL